MNGHARAALGGAGEAAAEAFLRARGMRTVERDVRLKGGQIDLVMLDGACLVVVEVKARSGSGFGLPQEGVHRRKLERLYRLAEIYQRLHPRLARDLRVDVVAVWLDRGEPVRLEHIPAVTA